MKYMILYIYQGSRRVLHLPKKDRAGKVGAL